MGGVPSLAGLIATAASPGTHVPGFRLSSPAGTWRPRLTRPWPSRHCPCSEIAAEKRPEGTAEVSPVRSKAECRVSKAHDSSPERTTDTVPLSRPFRTQASFPPFPGARFAHPRPRRAYFRRPFETPPLRRHHHRQLNKAGLVRRVIHPLRGLAIVPRLGPEDAGHKRLRIAVVQREPA